MKKTLGLFFGCIATFGKLSAMDTNVVYLPVDLAIRFEGEAKSSVQENQIRLARNSPESRPAELDVEGNWGKVTSGIQLSIRLATNVTATGKQISAVVILRNVMTNTISLLGTGPNAIDLTVKDQKGFVVWSLFSNSPPIHVSGPIATPLPGMRQIKYQIELPNVLTNAGNYTITAVRRGVPDGNNDWTEVRSGDAALRIVADNN